QVIEKSHCLRRFIIFQYFYGLVRLFILPEGCLLRLRNCARKSIAYGRPGHRAIRWGERAVSLVGVLVVGNQVAVIENVYDMDLVHVAISVKTSERPSNDQQSLPL